MKKVRILAAVMSLLLFALISHTAFADGGYTDVICYRQPDFKISCVVALRSDGTVYVIGTDNGVNGLRSSVKTINDAASLVYVNIPAMAMSVENSAWNPLPTALPLHPVSARSLQSIISNHG